ncbi:MAG: exopolysaccharide biosynthesis polyprenyl glycosylphosphotransferase [Candidatus Lustribacter sp.]|jgi:exopolysaccharide biosynthesis polyprenyl glycosylphosphotransferase
MNDTMTNLLDGSQAPACHAIRARRYDAYAGLAFAGADLVLFLLAAGLAEAIVFRTADVDALWRSFLLAPFVFVALWMALFAVFGLYRVSYAMSVRDEVYIVAAALVVGIVPQFFLFTFVPALTGSRLVLVLAAVLATILIGSARALAHVYRSRTDARTPRRIAFAGELPDAWVRGRINPAATSVVQLGGQLPATRTDAASLIERCRERDCTALYLTTVPPPVVLGTLISAAEGAGIALRIVIDPLLAGVCRFEIDDDGRGALLAPHPLRIRTAAGSTLKRIFDLSVATIMLIVAAPVMLAAGIAVFLETGRPVLFRHERIGRDGAPFEMLKFRSMAVRHAHGNGWAQRNDPRITRVGAVLRRLSIDELPQLLNVFRGDMSIVGPRPEMPEYVARFEAGIPHYAERHLVKPGITGWSQLYMKRLLTPDDAGDVLRHDLFYIQSWGLLMDASIVAKTAAEFLFHSPA